MLLTQMLMERSYPVSFSVRDIAYIPQLGLVSAFVSKNASSFLKTYLSCWARGSDFLSPKKNPHMPYNTGFQGVEQLGHQRMSELLRDRSVPKTVVGRHPVERLVSAYLTRIRTWQRETYDSHNRSDWVTVRQAVAGKKQGAHSLSALAAIGADISFDDLVGYVAQTPSPLLDRHLVPQADFAATDLIEYDLVGHVEGLDRYLVELADLLGRKPLDTSGVTVNATRSGESEPPVVSPASRQKISRRYATDFAFFGYTA